MINGANHITFSVSNLERSFDFYRDVVGLKPLAKWESGAYFLAGDFWFCLNLDTKTRNGPLAEYSHFAFSVAEKNFEAISARIKEAEVTLWQDNTNEGASIYFLDPDGHKLEIHGSDWQNRLAEWKRSPWPELTIFDLDQKESVTLKSQSEHEVKRISTGAPWETKVGYCRAVRMGNTIAVTGTVAIDENGAPYALNDAYVQAKRCLEIIDRAILQLGADRSNIIRTRMFVTDIKRWEEFGRAHAEYFSDHPPATSMIEIKSLIDPRFLIEIEADAVVLR